MKKILSLLALVLMSCMGAWAQTTVVARMSDLVGAGTNHDAVVSNLWKASEGDVYEFGNNHFIGGIANDDIKAALGSKYVTVAAWVYGRPTGGCIFSYGGQGDGIKFKLAGNQWQTTTKGKADYDAQTDNNVVANQWNLVAFTIDPTYSQTRYISGHLGHFGHYYTKKAAAGMKIPAEAGQLFAIGSGNQGDAREPFTGLLANVTVIASDNWLDANAKVADLVGAAPSMKDAPFVSASDLDHIGDAKWYKLKVKNQWAKYNPTKNTYDWTGTEPTDGTGYFALVGNSTENLKLFNYSNGMAVGSGNVNTDYLVRAVAAEEGHLYKLLRFTSGVYVGWQLEDRAKANARLNHLGAGLGYWVYGAGYDTGNNIEFVEVEDLTASNYFVYNVTATGENGNVSWKHAKFTNDTEASVSHIPAYEYISDYAIESTTGHNVSVTATSTMPVVAGKFYQLRQGSYYLSHTNEKNVNIRAAANNTLAKNLWYVQNCAYAPYVYLCCVENEKAVNVTSNGADNVRFSNVFDATSYEGAMAALEVKSVSGGFKINRAASTYNLGSHGNNKHDGVDDGANTGLGGWNNGNTAFVAEEFDKSAFEITNGEEGFVGYINDYEALTSAKTAYSENPTVANLKAGLNALANRIQIEEGKFYQITFKRGNQAFGNYGVWAGPLGAVSTEAASRTVTTADYATANVVAGLWQFENAANGKYLKTVASGFYLANVDGGHLVTTKEKQFGKTFTIVNGNNSVTTWQMNENGKSGDSTINIFYNPGNNTSREVTYWRPNDDGDYFTIKEVTEIPVSIGAAGYSTVAFPVAVTIPESVTAYKVTEETAEKMMLAPVTGSVVAGTALIIAGTEGAHNFAIADAETASEVEGNLLVGATVRRQGFTADSFYALASDGKGGVCFKINGEVNAVPAGKAFMNAVSATESNKALYFDFGGITTGIDAAEALEPATDALYNINGQRVVAPTRGIYVKANGQKVFIK